MPESANIRGAAEDARVETGPAVDDSDALRKLREEAEAKLEGAQAKVEKLRDHVKAAERIVREARAEVKEARQREKGGDD